MKLALLANCFISCLIAIAGAVATANSSGASVDARTDASHSDFATPWYSDASLTDSVTASSTTHSTASMVSTPVASFVHPITIEGKHFVDSVTGDRFYIRGVDYQPGGSAAYKRTSDPLSDPEVCVRDIYLMQQLGVNAVRVYTVNPQLDHSACMTMLAAANIYLLLDVNSPLVSESINRYEPWTTYTPSYLRHVFEVVEQFSRYNNTLGFFVGNEIVNDERSGAVSPPYIRAVTRDIKDYMYHNCPRAIPLGYSAADDLRYRTQLPHYLTCGERDTAVDFYGVNSYQWCGKQTIQTSGYDSLIKDHEDFGFPVMFSEFGCNHIQPRLFQEVEAIFSPEMTPFFEGGLVYEFSQEENNYGLVTVDNDGNAHLREEFYILKEQYKQAKLATGLPVSNNSTFTDAMSASGGSRSNSYVAAHSTQTSSRPNSRANRAPECSSHYSNLSGAGKEVPESFGTDMIRNGVRAVRGKYNTTVLEDMPPVSLKIFDTVGVEIANPRIRVVNKFAAHASELAWTARDNEFRKGNRQPSKANKKEKTTKSSNIDKANKSSKSSPQLLGTLGSLFIISFLCLVL